MKVRAGDALIMIERVFGPVEIVQWGSMQLAKPTPPSVEPTLGATSDRPVEPAVLRSDSLF